MARMLYNVAVAGRGCVRSKLPSLKAARKVAAELSYKSLTIEIYRYDAEWTFSERVPLEGK